MNDGLLHFHPEDEDPKDIYKLMVGLVVPRPIAFVSTVSADGVQNLAPFSFYNAICSRPPVICFSASVRSKPRPGMGPRKDTLENIRATGEFVVNVVSEEIVEQMNAAAAEVSPEVDEFALSGLTALPSERVKPPRVAEAKAQMECKLHQLVVVSEEPQGATLVLGEIVRFHVQADLVKRFHVDPMALKAVGRMAGSGYCRSTEMFDLERPVTANDAKQILEHKR